MKFWIFIVDAQKKIKISDAKEVALFLLEVREGLIPVNTNVSIHFEDKTLRKSYKINVCNLHRKWGNNMYSFQTCLLRLFSLDLWCYYFISSLQMKKNNFQKKEST